MITSQMIVPTVTLGCPKEKRGNDICGMCHQDTVRLHLFNRKPASQSMSLDASLPKPCITGTDTVFSELDLCKVLKGSVILETSIAVKNEDTQQGGEGDG